MPTPIESLRRHATRIFLAGVEAADPFKAVSRSLAVNNNTLEIALNMNESGPVRSGNWEKIHLVAFGKAACAMADAARQIIPAHWLSPPGIAVTNYENATRIENIQVMAASHPLPDEAGLKAAQAVADKVIHARQHELVLVLVSGGGSALLPFPAPGVSLMDKIQTTDLLLACGATINEVNCVRKHLSQLKGGGLARLAAPADLHALMLSDVLGDDLSSIASGPTVADATYFSDAVAILQDKGIWTKLPEPVRTHLNKGLSGEVAETPKNGDPLFANTGHTLLGSNRISVNAILRKASEMGYEATLYNDQMRGEARDVAEKLVLHAKQLTQQGLKKTTALLAGGETTVTLKGSGRGGRNQEMALAFALAARRHGLGGDWVFLSGGTDGRDGPTDAAGGLVDPGTLARITNPEAFLDNNDSYHALQQANHLLETGATGTNVADLQILLVQPTS